MATKSKKNTEKKEFDYKLIKSFEDACKKLGIDPLTLPQMEGIAGEFIKPILAIYKLIIIFKAINNGWIPDWSNWNQYKYYPWFEVLSSGFGFSGTDYLYVYTATNVGSRLCTDSSEKAIYIAEQFKAEYEDLFLYKE